QARAIEERAAVAWRRTAVAEAKSAQAEAKAAQAKANTAQAKERAAQAEAREIGARDWLQATRTSTSWRLTWPLRGLGQLLRGNEATSRHDNIPPTTSDHRSTPVALSDAALPPRAGKETIAIQALTYAAKYSTPTDTLTAGVTRNGG